MPPVLGPLAADPARACLLTDFDGTLAPIVADPYAARPLPGAVDALRVLAARLGTVGVVSGRPASFLFEVAGDGLVLSGLYGLELVRPGTHGRVEVPAEVERWRAVVIEVADEAEAAAPAGVLVERKGLALTLHTRAAAGAEGWVATFCAGAAARTGLQVHAAKMSLELRPPVGDDKGTAVRSLAAGATAVAYLGDDLGDLPAYTALDVLSEEGVTTVKVAVGGPELHPQVEAAADLVLDGPAACLAAVRELVALVGG
jgi:trehalose 6-phosphate phosphatase